jgi:predicted dehydrogenase
MKKVIKRRDWIVGAASVGLSAMSYRRLLGANEALQIASVGTGGKGWSDLSSVAASRFVRVRALCDIDQSFEHLGRAAEKFPEARRYSDWRKLLDEAHDLQGVIVSTPDFMHAPIAMAAMHSGKHVYCQKPLTHTVFEARQMRLAAEKYRSITQMGNQIQSHTAYRTAIRIVHDGLIGKVRHVVSWQSGKPKWPRNIDRPLGSDAVPGYIDWDLWTGVAPPRPYRAEFYHPFNWRGWRDFGTGQLGDFGCHILDPVFKGLALTAPISLVAEAPPIKTESWTDRAIVKFTFPKTDHTVGETLELTWYDGVDLHPPSDSWGDIPSTFKLPGAGSVLVGEKGTLLIPHVGNPRVFPEEKFPSESLPHVEGVDHYVQWADACRGVGQTTSHFSYAGPLTETVLLGTVGIRVPGERLTWDADGMRIVNDRGTSEKASNEMLTKKYRKGWEPTWV